EDVDHRAPKSYRAAGRTSTALLTAPRSSGIMPRMMSSSRSIRSLLLGGLLLLAGVAPAAAAGRDSFDAQFWKPAFDPFAYITLDPNTGIPSNLKSGKPGDLRTALKAAILDRESDPIGLGGKIELFWPTGSGGSFLSNDGRFAVGSALIVDTRLRLFRVGVEG